MKPETGHKQSSASVACLALACLLVGSLGVSTLFAEFRSVRKETVSASVTVGGNPFIEPVQIIHTPISGISPVTQMAIIQGKVGTENLQDPSLTFPLVNPAVVNPQAVTAEPIRVTVYFRLVLFGDPDPPPFVELASQTRNDPDTFFFQVTPSSITTGLFQYKIRAEKLNAAGNPIARAWFPEGVTTEQDEVYQQVGVEAAAIQVVGTGGGKIIIRDGNPNDGETRLDIPAGLFQSSATITLNEVTPQTAPVPPLNQFSDVITIFHMDTVPPFQGTMKLSMLYQDFLNPFGQANEFGSDGIFDGTEASVDTGAVYWWDGFSWRAIGGRLLSNANVISAKVFNSGYFAIVSAGPLTPQTRRPVKRILTPNGDGHNDNAIFTMTGVTGAEIEIFDMTGHRVRSIRGSDGVFMWDGRDGSGKVVESGVYIYQYEVDGERVSGLIAVAK